MENYGFPKPNLNNKTMKIKLITSYRTWEAGEELDTDKIKADELVGLGRAEYLPEIKKAVNKKMTSKRKRVYKPRKVK